MTTDPHTSPPPSAGPAPSTGPAPLTVARHPRRRARAVGGALVSLLVLAGGTLPSTAGVSGSPAAPHRASAFTTPVAGTVLARPFDPPVQNWLAGHRGVDLVATVGDDVRSPAAGTVTFAGPVAGRPVVVVQHENGLVTSLEPVAPEVDPGDVLAAGDPVGVLDGAAGHCAPRSCLHWGVRRAGAYVDPMALLGLGPVVLLPEGPQ